MSEHGPVVGIDLGSSKVSVVVGEVEDQRLVVRGCGQATHDGARKGVIANLDDGSALVQPTVNWWVSENVTALFGVFWGYGEGLDEDDGLQSEYGAVATSIWASVQVFF